MATRAILPTELWALSRGADSARCVVADHPMGIELRYVMNRHPLITRVFASQDELAQQARVWREGLEARGWAGRART